jgi:ABC-type sulfate transport system permease component
VTVERIFSLAGTGLFVLVMIVVVLLFCLWVFSGIMTYIHERGWKRVWREIVATAKVLAWVVGVLAVVLAVFTGIGWLTDHFLHFNVNDL